MRKKLITAMVGLGMLLTPATSVFGAVHRRVVSRTRAKQIRHKRRIRTARRVGTGAAVGAAVGAIAGGGKGAAIGAGAGAGAGALYDQAKRRER
jgi:hypothetical protein